VRERARARHSQIAETIRRITASGETHRGSARGGNLSENRSFGGVDEGAGPDHRCQRRTHAVSEGEQSFGARSRDRRRA